MYSKNSDSKNGNKQFKLLIKNNYTTRYTRQTISIKLDMF